MISFTQGFVSEFMDDVSQTQLIHGNQRVSLLNAISFLNSKLLFFSHPPPFRPTDWDDHQVEFQNAGFMQQQGHHKSLYVLL